MNKPSFPLDRIINENLGGCCPNCKSSEVKKYLKKTAFQFGKKEGCINPECKNYYLNV